MPRLILFFVFLIFTSPYHFSQASPESLTSPNTALINGKWFNGSSFDTRTFYSVDGRFTSKKPRRVDRTIDLAGMWIVPPFAEGHNHNIGTGVENRERKAIEKYVADGVFYVKIQGNFPITEERKIRLGINRPDTIEAVFAQGSFTGSGGHPIRLVETVLLPQGYYPGQTKESLKDRYYITIDSEAEVREKFPLVLGTRADFVKTILFYSNEFEKRKNDPAFFGLKGLDPKLLAKIVNKAHQRGLRLSTHVTNAADFHFAVEAGVDEIVHFPYSGSAPIAEADAKLAAARGIVVIPTASLITRISRPDSIPELKKLQIENLKLLARFGIPLAVGSDNVADSSLMEIEYLRDLGVLDNLTLLKMWAETTPKTIFPKRRIGALKDGYEASFLALEGNPIEDFQNVRRIKVRFKQGFALGQ